MLSLAIVVTALPSALWRLAGLSGAFGDSNPVTVGLRSEWGDVLVVSFGSVLWLGFLALASERVVRAGGRNTFARAVVLPALCLTAGLLIAADVYAASTTLLGVSVNLDPLGRTLDLEDPTMALAKVCYAPLMLAGPLLLARAFGVLRFRTGSTSAPGR